MQPRRPAITLGASATSARQAVLLLGVVVVCEVVAFAVVKTPQAAVAGVGLLALVGAGTLIREPLRFWLWVVPVLPVLNYLVYDASKVGAALATDAALLIAAIASLRFRSRSADSFGGLDWFLVLFAATVTVSTATSGGLDGPRFLIGGILPATGAYFVLRRTAGHYSGSSEAVWWSFAGLGAFLAASGVIEAATASDLFSTSGGVRAVSAVGGIQRVNGPFATDIDYALSLILALCVVLGGWTGSAAESVAKRRVAPAIVASMFVAMYFTYFRTVWLVALVMTLLWLSRRGTGNIALVGLGLLTAVVAVTSINSQKLSQNNVVKERVTSQENILGREATYKKALDVFGRHPITGIGFTNFQADKTYVAIGGVKSVDTPHSLYLGTAAETGLVGIIGLLGTLALLIGSARRLRHSHAPEVAGLARGAWWAVIVFLIFSVDFQTLTLPFPLLLVFSVTGMAAGWARAARNLS